MHHTATRAATATPTPTDGFYDIYPLQPSNTVYYVPGVQKFTLTYQDGNVKTMSVSNVLVESTSYYDAAEGTSFIQAEESFSIKYSAPEYTAILWTMSNATSHAESLNGTATLVTLDQLDDGAMSGAFHRGSIAAIVVGSVFAALGLLLWRRRRRVGSWRAVWTRSRRTWYDEEERAEREMSQRPDFKYMDGSYGRTGSSSSSITSDPYSEPRQDSKTELGADLPLSPVSTLQRNNTRRYMASISNIASQCGSSDVNSLHESRDSDAASLTSVSTRVSQRPIQSNGPWPLPFRPSGAPSYLAELARLRAQKYRPDPIVNEHFLGPKDHGEAGEGGFDWRRCSFATLEEQAMWIKNKSEVSIGGTPSHHAHAMSEDASYGGPSAAPSGRISWRSTGLRGFTSEEERIAWLRTLAGRERAGSGASLLTVSSRAWSQRQRAGSDASTGPGSSSDSSISTAPSHPPGRVIVAGKGQRQRSHLSELIDPLDCGTPDGESAPRSSPAPAAAELDPFAVSMATTAAAQDP